MKKFLILFTFFLACSTGFSQSKKQEIKQAGKEIGMATKRIVKTIGKESKKGAKVVGSESKKAGKAIGNESKKAVKSVKGKKD